jgi:hypothetical protein
MSRNYKDRVQDEATAALSEAEKALAEADNKALFNQVKRGQEDKVQLAAALDAIVGVYADESLKRPRSINDSDSAIDAMREVALAAVELAKAVVAAK